MTDSITVRVTLDESSVLHPETRVYVQLPEVARVHYLLPAERYEGLKHRPWPEVLDVAQEHAERGWAVTAPTAAARAAVAEWLRDKTNRDEMQAAWELDQARQNPVAREWHKHVMVRDAEIERLKAVIGTARAMHVKHADSEHCQYDDMRWPCPTVVALGETDGPGEATAGGLNKDVCLHNTVHGYPGVHFFKRGADAATQARCVYCGTAQPEADHQRAAAEATYDGPQHHTYRLGRDLPPVGGASC